MQSSSRILSYTCILSSALVMHTVTQLAKLDDNVPHAMTTSLLHDVKAEFLSHTSPVGMLSFGNSRFLRSELLSIHCGVTGMAEAAFASPIVVVCQGFLFYCLALVY